MEELHLSTGVGIAYELTGVTFPSFDRGSEDENMVATDEDWVQVWPVVQAMTRAVTHGVPTDRVLVMSAIAGDHSSSLGGSSTGEMSMMAPLPSGGAGLT